MSVKQNIFVSVFVHKCLMVLNDVEYTTFKMFVTQMSNYLFVISFQLMFYKMLRCSLARPLGHIVVNTFRLAASQFSKIKRPVFFWFQIVCSCKTQVTVEKNLLDRLRYDLVQLRGNSCSSTSLKKSKVIWTNFRDKLQFVNWVKRLVFDLTKIPFLKCLFSI